MAELPTVRLAFQDYIASVTRLMLAANSTDRATDLFNAVLTQAIELGRTSE